MTVKLYIRVSDEVGAKVIEWADKLGVTRSQLGGMAVTAGIGAILRAVSPEDAIAPDKLALIIKAMEDLTGSESLKKGVESGK